MRSSRLTLILALLFGTGCSGVTFTGVDGSPIDSDADPPVDGFAMMKPDADAGGDTGTDTGVDSGIDAPKEASCPYQGAVECQNAVDAFCSHYSSCCAQNPGNGFCNTWGSNTNQCKAHFAQGGMCTDSKYTKMVCTSASGCSGSINGASCSLVFQSTGPDSNNFACSGFWSQF